MSAASLVIFTTTVLTLPLAPPPPLPLRPPPLRPRTVAKYANTTKVAFWAETDPHARWEQIQKARNGGSVNPTFLHILHKHQKSGRLTIHTLSEAEDATYDSTSGKWAFDVVTKPDPKLAAKVEPGLAAAEAKRFTLDNIDYLVSSTGSKIDLSAIPFVQPLLKSHPVELINGFPVLTADLQYNEAVPLFVMGAFSMLEVRFLPFLSCSSPKLTFLPLFLPLSPPSASLTSYSLDPTPSISPAPAPAQSASPTDSASSASLTTSREAESGRSRS